MDQELSRRQVLAGGGVVATTSLAGCVAGGDRDATATVTETYATDGVDALRVSNTNGDVTVRGEDREDVSVRGEKAAASQDDLDSVRLVDSRDGSTLTLDVETDDGPFVFRLGPTPKMDLEVTVPRSLRVERVETTNGQVTASDVEGDLAAETTNGDVELASVRGDVSAETTNGGVRIEDVQGSVTADTTNGRVEVVGVAGDVTVETTNGDVLVRDVDGDVHTDTTNGRVEVENATGSVTRD